MASRLVKDTILAGVEFLFLLLLWMIFVSNGKPHEIAIGIAAAAIGATADAIVKAEGLAPFSPRARWVVLVFWEPWYAAKGTALALREFVRAITGHRPRARFQAVPYRYGGDDDTAAAKRALFTAFMTVSPDTIVVGLDKDQHIALIHQLGSNEVPEIGRRLGAEA